MSFPISSLESNFALHTQVYLSEYPMCTWEEFGFYCCWVECSINVLRSSWLMLFSSSISSLILYLYLLLREGCWHQLVLWICLFLLSVLTFALCIWNSVVKHKHSGLLCLLSEFSVCSLSLVIFLAVNIFCLILT